MGAALETIGYFDERQATIPKAGRLPFYLPQPTPPTAVSLPTRIKMILLEWLSPRSVMIEPYQVHGYRLNAASVTANARDVPAALWFLAAADCEGRPFFLLSCEGRLESAGVTQLCRHRNSRPSCTRTVVAGRANAATIKTNQANALRT